MKPKTRLIIYIVLTILMMALIFVQSALPADLSQMESGFLSEFLARQFHWNSETTSFIIRKFAHFLEYTVLGVLLSLTVRQICLVKRVASNIIGGESASKDTVAGNPASDTKVPGLVYFLSWAIGTFYALTDEFHQKFVEGRSCELRDLCIDAAGVLLGTLLVYLIGKRSRQNS